MKCCLGGWYKFANSIEVGRKISLDRSSWIREIDWQLSGGLKRCARWGVRFEHRVFRVVRRTDSCEKVIKRGRRAQRRPEQRNGYIPLLFTFETKESLFSLSFFFFFFFVRYATDGKHRTAFQHIQRLRGTISRVFRAVFTRRAFSRAFIQREAARGSGFLWKSIDYRGSFAFPWRRERAIISRIPRFPIFIKMRFFAVSRTGKFYIANHAISSFFRSFLESVFATCPYPPFHWARFFLFRCCDVLSTLMEILIHLVENLESFFTAKSCVLF